jgi:hypothetical protein
MNKLLSQTFRLSFLYRGIQDVVKHKEVKYSGALVRQRTIPTERPPLVGEDSANFSG